MYGKFKYFKYRYNSPGKFNSQRGIKPIPTVDPIIWHTRHCTTLVWYFTNICIVNFFYKNHQNDIGTNKKNFEKISQLKIVLKFWQPSWKNNFFVCVYHLWPETMPKCEEWMSTMFWWKCHWWMRHDVDQWNILTSIK